MLMNAYFTRQYTGKFVHMGNVLLVYTKAEVLFLILFLDSLVLVRA